MSRSEDLDTDRVEDTGLVAHEAEGGGVPSRPLLAASKWFTILMGNRYWLCYSMGSGEDRYFITKGSRRMTYSYPFTEYGWREAWRQFAALEPRQSRRYGVEQQRIGKPELVVVSLGPKAIYMGGLPEYPNQISGALLLSRTHIGLGETRPEKAVIPLSEIESIDIRGGTVSKSKVGATVAFGVLGGIGSRDTKTEVSVVAHLKNGASAYYILPDSREGSLMVRAKAGPILQMAGVPFADDSAPTGSASDITDQLLKLATLREEGLLTLEEFEKAKANLLR